MQSNNDSESCQRIIMMVIMKYFKGGEFPEIDDSYIYTLRSLFLAGA